MFIKLPDNRRIPLDNCVYQPVNNAVIFTYTNGGSTSYKCVNSAGATAMAASIDTKVAANQTNYNSVDAVTDTGALVWTSITPNTSSANPPEYNGTVVGSGFSGSGVNSVKFDDGSGHIYIGGNSITDDTHQEVSFTPPVLVVAGTYTLYFSTDSGSSWTTTGLTVTVT